MQPYREGGPSSQPLPHLRPPSVLHRYPSATFSEWPTPPLQEPLVERAASSSSSPSIAHAGNGTSAFKLTPSCSRCREKKLKCRFPDGANSACTICVNKGLADKCQRDVRMARKSRGIKTEKNAKPYEKLVISGKTARPSSSTGIGISNGNGGNIRHNNQSNNWVAGPEDARKAEIITLKRRLAELESWHAVKPPSPASTADSTAVAGEQSPGSLLYATPADLRKRKEAETAAVLLEDFTTNGRRRKLNSSGNLPRDSAQEKWQKATTLSERLELLQAAKQCPIASDAVVVRELVSVFLHRINHLAGHVIYGPGYLRAVEAFLSMSVEEIVMSKMFIDPSCLATLMLMLCLGFQFHPRDPPHGGPPSAGFLAVQSLRQRSLNPVEDWYSIARRCVSIEESYHLASLPALQAACLFLVMGKESRSWLKMMHYVAISSAQDFGLHKLGQADISMETEDFIRFECGVRIWNFLVMRDWSMATEQGHAFLIHPSQMTTRKPLNIEDEDLDSGTRESKPMSEWTRLSFVIVQIELAELIRDWALMRDERQQMQQQGSPIGYHDGCEREQRQLSSHLDIFMRRLPSYFQLEGHGPGLVHVQRWLLNQQIFDLHLRLWRSDLMSVEGQATCLRLAESVIAHQASIRSICPVIDSLQINSFHLFGACMIVLLSLLHSSSSIQPLQHRYTARARVQEALKMFVSTPHGKRAMQVLEVMLEYEEDCYQRKGQFSGPSGRDDESVNLAVVAERIIEQIHPGPKSSPHASRGNWPAILPPPPSPMAPSIPDQTLLPTVGAWRRHENISHFAASQLDQTTNKTQPIQGDAAINPRPVFDWALSLAQDPFEPGKDPSSLHKPSVADSHQYTLNRYLHQLDNFNPIMIEKQKQQALHNSTTT